MWECVFLRLARRSVDAFEVLFNEDVQFVSAGVLQGVNTDFVTGGPLLKHTEGDLNNEVVVGETGGDVRGVRGFADRVPKMFFRERAECGRVFDDATSGEVAHFELPEA